MKTNKYALLLALLCLPMALCAQTADDSTFTLDLLQAPSSPAASMLGIATSDIQKPTDPSAFMVSLQGATNNLTAIPGNYAVDIAPAWLFFGKNIRYEEFIGNNVRHNLWQSLVISAATTTSKKDAADPYTNLGIGVKTSFFRGKVDAEALAVVDSSLTILSRMQTFYTQAENEVRATEEYREASPQEKRRLLREAQEKAEGKFKAKADSLKDMAQRISFRRYGFKMDLSAGMALHFPGQVFSDGRVAQAGAWMTLGWETKGGFSTLGLLRYLYHGNKLYEAQKDSSSTLDAGLRLSYAAPKSKFSLGGEGIYRGAIGSGGDDPSWRFTVNADYKVSKNTVLSAAFGRNFDGTFQKDGNVIAALNLVLGFGNSRKATQLPANP